MKNVKMEIILNMMDVIIVDINVNPNVQNVLKVNAMNVQQVDGVLILLRLLGFAKKNVVMV